MLRIAPRPGTALATLQVCHGVSHGLMLPRNPRVLQVLPEFVPAGAESIVFHLATGLHARGFEVGIASLYGPAGTLMERALETMGIPVWYARKQPGPSLKALSRLLKITREFRPAVIHSHQYVLRYVLPVLLRHSGIAGIHTIHGLAETQVGWLGHIVGRMAFRARVVPVAVAERVALSARRTYGDCRMCLIPNAIPVARHARLGMAREEWRRREGFASADVVFVCVAGLRPEKNHIVLLTAFALALPRMPLAHLVLVGDGVMKRELEERARLLGIESRVRWLGTRSDVPETLDAADVFVLASKFEGRPLAVMEAMAAGKPVVATAAGGTPELVLDPDHGVIVPCDDAAAFARGMLYFYENPDARARCGRAAAKRAADRFDVARMVSAYAALYAAVPARSALPFLWNGSPVQ